MTATTDHDDAVVRLATIIALGAVSVAAIAGLTIVAVFTDRDLFRAELLTLVVVALLAATGGVSLWEQRRHRWHVSVDRNGHDQPVG